MSIGLRIKELRKREGLNQIEFSTKIGVKQSPLSQMESGKILPSLETVSKIIREFNISYSWLIDGIDEETKSIEKPIKKNDRLNDRFFMEKRKVQKNLSIKGKQYKGIPLIPIDAMASFGTGSIQVMAYEASNYVVPEFEELKAEFMIRVKGSSMYPKYNSGDLVACKKLNLNSIFFQWNKVYVLDTEQGALIKRIKKSEKEGCIKLVSDNPNYDPYDLPFEDIYSIAFVVGVIRLE